MSRRLLPAVALLAAVLLAGCTEDVENTYTSVRAFFRFTPVTSVHQLNTALNNPGMFCSVTFNPQSYVFTDSEGNATSVNRTALDLYGTPVFICGFIVGTPSLPDVNGNFYNVAYDLVCPNCYHDDAIQRSLAFSDREEVTCNRCRRSYTLSNGGLVRSGESGRSLLRYRLTYSAAQNTLVIQN